jgi:hypothetical protein
MIVCIRCGRYALSCDPRRATASSSANRTLVPDARESASKCPATSFRTDGADVEDLWRAARSCSDAIVVVMQRLPERDLSALCLDILKGRRESSPRVVLAAHVVRLSRIDATQGGALLVAQTNGVTLVSHYQPPSTDLNRKWPKFRIRSDDTMADVSRGSRANGSGT